MTDRDNVRIKGVFDFFSNGELIGSHTNAFTVAGRSIAIKSLLGHIPDFVNSIAVGVGSSANILNSTSTLITNNSLDFEIARNSTIGSTLQITANGKDALIFYTTLTDSNSYQINEVGLFPSNTQSETISIDGEVLIGFNNVQSIVGYGTYSNAALEESASARIGTKMLKLLSGGSLAANYSMISYDSNTLSLIDSYTSTDTFRLAGFNQGAAATCSVVFCTSNSDYYTVPFVFPTGISGGYYVAKKAKGEAVITGTPTWSSINSIKLFSNNEVYLDGLKLDIGPDVLDTNFGMVSRAVLPSGIEKQSSIPLTIQYSLIVDFSGGT